MRSAGLIRHGSAQRGFELLFIRIRYRQPQDPVPVPVRRQHFGKWPNRFGIIGNQKPGNSLAGCRSEAIAADFSQPISYRASLIVCALRC